MTDDLRERVALRPCPFCGDPMEGSVTDCEAGFARGPYGSLMVQCDSPECATIGPSSQTMDGAVGAWNNRAKDAIAEMGGTAPDNAQEAARVLLGDGFNIPMLEALDPFNNNQDVAQDVLDALRALAEGQEND